MKKEIDVMLIKFKTNNDKNNYIFTKGKINFRLYKIKEK